jgi:MoaA/NifB/PqqE/SkfB family radical SAM enzyme
MTFCYSPWTNIDINTEGSISPCCKFKQTESDNRIKISEYSIAEYKSSELLTNVKQQFLNGQWPSECERCRVEEENGIESKRQMDSARWQQQYQDYDLDRDTFITASVSFGNTCNLTCITCNPYSSSRWQKEHTVIYGANIVPYHFYKKDFVEEFVQHAENITHIDISGGEPFLSGVNEQKELLKFYVSTDRAKRMSLHYTTNATVFPDNEFWDLWSHFQEVDLQLSIDGTGNKFEYIRYPAEWPQVLSNIQKYQAVSLPNVRLSVSHTVSAYNIYYLDEFYTWCTEQGLPVPWAGKVHKPARLRPTVWPAAVRQLIVDKLKHSSRCELQPWITLLTNVDDSNYFEDFVTHIQQHDQYRNLNFEKTFPELAPYI